MSNLNIPFIIISVICFIPAIVLHEVSHGFAAYKMGDLTAKSAGRLSLNPLKHIDPFGTVILPLILIFTGAPVFGYAKPVPYNPNRFRNMKKGEVITGLAGPAANLVLALVSGILAWVLYFVLPDSLLQQGNWLYWLLTALYYFIFINLVLMFFNLIPIPPLDGSSVIMPFIPRQHLHTWYTIQRYSLPILLILVLVLPMLGSFMGYNFNPIGWYIQATAGNLSTLLFPF